MEFKTKFSKIMTNIGGTVKTVSQTVTDMPKEFDEAFADMDKAFDKMNVGFDKLFTDSDSTPTNSPTAEVYRGTRDECLKACDEFTRQGYTLDKIEEDAEKKLWKATLSLKKTP